VLEPHVNPDGMEGVTVDLFVINTEAEGYTGKELANLANANATGELSKVSPTIRLTPDAGAITRIVADDEFNAGKGEAFIVPPETGMASWEIRLSKLQEHGILKFIVSSTEKRQVLTRGDLGTVPLTLDYARSQ
jgi:hypothetical protein